MASSMIDDFLTEVSQILNSGDGARLQQYLPIEPPFSGAYNSIIQQIQSQYHAGSEPTLENKAKRLLSGVQLSSGEPWSAFINFMVQYLHFIRDVNPSNLLDTYNQLSELVQKCNSALLAPEVGVVMLPTAISHAKVLARLALGLEKQPELIVHLVDQSTDEGGERVTLAERAANTIRQAFVACLNENAPTSMNQMTTPLGRLAGIYTFANICLKIFFQCKKTKNAEQIFANIGAKSPPIEIYPRSERVTYLYYLGRFFFSVNHFYRAQLTLQSAYDNCPIHSSAQKQRRLILIYLTTANIILGRLPTEHVYQKPESQGFRQRFQPICNAIIKGDLATFRRLTDSENEHAPWFVFHRVFLQIRSRCEVHVWRSLCRRVWLLNGNRGDPESRRAPYLELEDLVRVSRYLEQRYLSPRSRVDGGAGNRHTNWVFMSQEPPKESQYTDPDFDGLEQDDEYYDDSYEDNPFLLPDMPQIESVVSSLISQGLVNGFISTQKKLAIQGASKRPALEAGWPNVWQTIKTRCEKNGGDIPGWKRIGGQQAPGASRVINLSGARPVGM